MAIIDCTTYNGEADILEIRLNILNDYVDEFVIVEFPITFSGRHKAFSYFERDRERFKEFLPKIKFHYTWDYRDPKFYQLASESPNVPKGGPDHWGREFMQKESIKLALTHLKDDDVVFIGDVDEIWNPELNFYTGQKLKLKVYTYFLNNRSSEEFWGTIVDKYKNIKNSTLNHLRTTDLRRSKDYYGWHFTSLAPELKRKLTDSYTEKSYATKDVLDNLDENVKSSKDFLGRDFTYKIDESEWPEYLKKNREKYRHLLKPEE